MKMKRSLRNISILTVSALLTAGAVFAFSDHKPASHKPAKLTQQLPPKPQPPAQPATPAPPTNYGFYSVDFDHMPLSDVAQFVTSKTGNGFVLSGLEAQPVTWIEYHITPDKLFDSFKAALTASGLVLKPSASPTLFTVAKPTPEEPLYPVRLDYAASSRGVFFLFNGVIYPKDQFPFKVRYDAGHYYAMVPKITADKQLASEQDTSTRKQ